MLIIIYMSIASMSIAFAIEKNQWQYKLVSIDRQLNIVRICGFTQTNFQCLSLNICTFIVSIKNMLNYVSINLRFCLFKDVL